MKKIIEIVGTRPQFVKLSAVSRAVRKAGFDYVLINTDQHYDDRMSKVFFRELQIVDPTYSLGIGSGTHAQQTARMMLAIEEIFNKEKPSLVQVYGDTNSTIAPALVAAKMSIPISHIEAGLRGYNDIPEEINRVATDHMSDLLFVPTKESIRNLKKEGLVKGVVWTGDVMLDVVENWKRHSKPLPPPVSGDYIITTIHRPDSVDHADALRSILEGLRLTSVPVVLPVHPRLKKSLAAHQITLPPNIVAVEPYSHAEMMSAVHHSRLVITDSGGLQKEAFFIGRRCISMRNECEWIELIRAGVNELSGTDTTRIARAAKKALKNKNKTVSNKALFKEYGEGKASDRVAKELRKFLGR